MSRNAKNGYVFMPPSPLGAMLLSALHDVTDLTDSSRPQPEIVYARDSSTGKLVPFTQIDPVPTQSSATIQAPYASAQALRTYTLRYPDCPTAMQIRYYDCDAPGKNPHGWSDIIHVDHITFGNSSFSNLTAQGPNVDDAVPTVSVEATVWKIDELNRQTPGYFQRAAVEPASDLLYVGAPGCGECEGLPTSGCERLYAIFDDGMYTSGNSGATWTLVTTGITFSTGGSLTQRAGRLVASNDTLIYYSDTPLGGASGWSQATLPTAVAVTSIGRMAASDTYLFAIANSSGILRSADNGATWDWVSEPAAITNQAQHDISADGEAVFTCGASDDGLLSLDNGDVGSWSLVTQPGTTDTGRGCHVAQWSERSERAVVLFVSIDDGTSRDVYRSTDHGETWSEVLALNAHGGTHLTSIRSALHGWVVYVNDEELTYKSVGGGDSFFEISNSSVPAGMASIMALCPYDPNAVFVIGANAA